MFHHSYMFTPERRMFPLQCPILILKSHLLCPNPKAVVWRAPNPRPSTSKLFAIHATSIAPKAINTYGILYIALALVLRFHLWGLQYVEWELILSILRLLRVCREEGKVKANSG